MVRSLVYQCRSPEFQLIGDDLVSQRNIANPDPNKIMRRENYDWGSPIFQAHLVITSSIQQQSQSSELTTIKQQATTMADDDYVSPYTVDDRTRRSVMAAQVSNKSIQEVQDGDFRRSTPRKFPRFQPEFNGDSFLSALSTITVVIEGLCFEGAEGWDEVQRLVPEKPRVSSRLIGGPSQPTVNFGNDRAVCGVSFEVMVSELTWKIECYETLLRERGFLLLPSILMTEILNAKEVC